MNHVVQRKNTASIARCTQILVGTKENNSSRCMFMNNSQWAVLQLVTSIKAARFGEEIQRQWLEKVQMQHLLTTQFFEKFKHFTFRTSGLTIFSRCGYRESKLLHDPCPLQQTDEDWGDFGGYETAALHMPLAPTQAPNTEKPNIMPAGHNTVSFASMLMWENVTVSIWEVFGYILGGRQGTAFECFQVHIF
jgi:hypothetical protein